MFYDLETKSVRRGLLAKLFLASGLFLCATENAHALPNLVLTTSFTPADGSRTYMDIGGTWNGTTEVSGDSFTLSIQNTGPDPAYDIRDIPVTVPAGFISGSNSVTVTDVGIGCPNMTATANQSGAGNPVTINIQSNNSTTINPGCTYNYTFILNTNSSASAGNQSLGYTVTYNTINNNNGSFASVNGNQNVQVNAGSLAITKTTPTATAFDGDTITYNIAVTSNGTGGLFDVALDDTISAALGGLSFSVPNPPPGSLGPANVYTFEYLAAGETVNLTAQATVQPAVPGTCPILQNDASLSERNGVATAASGAVLVDYDFPFTSGTPSSVITHNALTSFCELCGDGTVSIILQNPVDVPLTNLTVVEDLLASGLAYIPGTTTSSIGPAADPVISGTSLTWTTAQIPALANLDPGVANNIVITFGVRRLDEGLVTANRNIRADVDFSVACKSGTQNVDTGLFELPIQQPAPQVTKLGRNVDAGQGVGSYAATVYGHVEDSVIWRVDVLNTGQGDLEDLLVDDTIGGNFDINWVCSTEAAATNATNFTNGGAPAGCVSAGGGTTTSVLNFAVDDPFGNPGNDENGAFVDVTAGTSGYVYYVGRIQPACTNHTNSANIEWGCEVNSPPEGGIISPATTGGIPPAFTINSSADLSALVNSGGLDIQQAVTGINTSQPVGSSGTVTIQFTNLTGATIRNIDFTDTLPPQYVVDATFAPTAVVTPAYGSNYAGMIDIITWDNQDVNPLNNIAPHFTLTSSTSRPVTTVAGDDVNLLRHGDVLTVTFRIVVIDVPRYDVVANLDVTTENQADGTDPDSDFTVTNRVSVNFDNICGQTGLSVPDSVENHPADIEDLDVDTSDALYILTNNPGTPLPLNVLLTNNGGHDADNYVAYVSFGQAMTVSTVPAGCAVTTNPPTHPVWNDPTIIPATAAVYACDRGPIAPGNTETITFEVIKAASPAVDDDLTFRVDVIGEVTLSDGTPLTFPAPQSIAGTTPNLQLANNYTLDAVRARVLGFNLVKSAWYCAEDGLAEPAPPADMLSAAAGAPNTPTLTGNTDSRIGEDCNYRIESGGWFGFLTPGFTLIAVEDVVVTDDLPDGQGFIPFGGSAFNFNSTPFIQPVGGADYGAGTTQLDETDISWTFNAAGNGIVIKDEFFRVDFKTRLLNDPVDLAYPVPGGYSPNLHANISTNIARTSFNARFDSTLGNVTIPVDDSAGIPGYPVQSIRQVDLTEVEPNLIVTKEVCNETLNGIGTGCSVFSTTVNDGDTNDSYIYRITLTNEASDSGVARSPAYNVISTDTLDASDLMFIMPFASDGLDNDGDGLIDAADPDGEGTISDNVISNGTPAVITVSNTHSAPLLDVAPGASVTFYYRVDPDDAIAPLQTLTNTVSMSFDSLEGDFGNQNDPQIDNAGTPTSGRARIYTSIDAQANVQMIPLLAQPKRITAVANSTLGGPLQAVVPGEELRYELTAELPVANLRNFRIRDELPAGVRCIEQPPINLTTDARYVGAGFNPGGPPQSTTCTSTGTNDVVEWNFGDQELTMATAARFDFVIDFVARIENTAVTNDGVVITNGGTPVNPATCTGGVGVCYVNEAGTDVALDFASVDVIVREPQIAITKSFVPVVNSDAGDVVTVTVTATNNGSAAAYNLRVLDDLVGSDMTFIPGSLSGTDPPDNADIVTLGANQPIFSWNIVNPDYQILPTEVKTFTFDVQVDTTAQPLEILDNTIEAEWSSLPSQATALNATGLIGADGSALGLRNGAVPNAADVINDYEDTASASVSVLPVTVAKTDIDPAVVPTIGAHKNFQIEISLPEGTTNGLVVTDNLNTSGLSYVLSDLAPFDITYQFVGIQSINGSTTLNAAAFNAVPVNGATGNIVWDIGDIVTLEEDDPTATAIDPVIRIQYFARVNNDLVTDDGDNLQNSVIINYTNGEDATTETSAPSTTPVETVAESNLVITKTATNITSGGPTTSVGDVIEFRISLDNTTGNSTAFDANIVDTLPASLLLDVTFTPTLTGPPIVGFIATPSGGPAGPLVWGRGNADNSLDIPAGQTLILTYRTIVQPGTPPGAIISNSALVDWTSLDDADPASPFERTGAGCPAITAPNDYCAGPAVAAVSTGPTSALFKANPVDTDISIGEQFSYSITVPGTPQGTALYDVQILDNLAASTADLGLVSITRVSGSQPWVPVNSGTSTNLIIEDVTNGIDIPAGDQVEVLVTVVMRNANPPNIDGLTFDNSATYTFNLIDNNNGSRTAGPGNTTPVMTVVEPDLQLDKRGPATPVSFGNAIPYTLVVENVGTGAAFDQTIVDQLPDVPDVVTMVGGTCDATPLNFNARITTSADEATALRNLVINTDYTATYTAAPTCELVITALTDAARIEAGEKFIIDYDASLDAGSQSGAALTNIAGVTQWFSLDTAGAGATGDIREYTRVITDGTTATVDHEDAFTVTVQAPVLDFQKTVFNVTTGNPGTDASPGDTLRYSLLVTNTGPLNLTGFTITDEVDALAGPGGSFVPGSMTNFNIPAGADNSNTNINGGNNSAGLLDVRNLSIDAAGGANDTVLIEFDVTLLPVIQSGSVVLNQAQMNSASTGIVLSDDPLVGGAIDPTETLISSAPLLQVQKSSQDITGNPALLQAGDTLNYTITVKNIGTENVINAVLTDQVPANTTYLAGSTTLNGVVVTDPAAGVSALATGLPIYAPENSTSGFLRADTSATANNVATITFAVVVNPTAIDGTVISNQGFVTGDGAGSGAFPQRPSDDPTTVAVDDPTIDIVGNIPLFDVQKTVAIVTDGGTAGIVDPNDVLRYTITLTNFGAAPVTNVLLTDAVPASSSYVANSVTLNGIAVTDTAPGVSPLIAGIDVSSSDLTPPLPATGAGVLVPGQSAIIEFDVTVAATATPGTVISNQGFVSSNELPVEPTDADGIDSNGDQPTDVTVGNAPSVIITKQVSVVGGGPALAGGELEYIVRVTNTGLVPVTNVVITDDIDLPVAGEKTYIANSALLNGLPTGTSFAGSTLTADYSATYGDLAPSAVAELRFRVTLSGALNIGDSVINTADVVWNVPPSNASASVSIDIGGTPGTANLNGRIWHDEDFSNDVGAGERLLSGWSVGLYNNNVLIASTLSDGSGNFQFSGLPPNLPAGNPYELRYSAPGATASSATLGNASSAFTNAPHRITDILAASGASVQDLNLPIQPNGVVFNSVVRTAVPGARLIMVNQTRSNQVVPDFCFDDPAHANQVTLADGWYKFDLNFSDPSRCAQGDEYEIQVQPPANDYVGTTSVIIPPLVPVTGPALDVINCPLTANDLVATTALQCETSTSAIPPGPVTAAASVNYMLKFLFSDAPGVDQIYNNHIAVDPDLGSAVAISKIAGKQNVVRSDLVPYTITVNNTLAVPLDDLRVVDNYPAGFKYVSGSSRLDGNEVEPQINGRRLSWDIGTLGVGETREIKLLLIVGSGAGEGEYVNTAQMFNTVTGGAASGIASATVRVIPDPTFDCTDIIGKVYDDKNMNAYQDDGEKGLPGVQVATARGLRVTTDAHGRFHITCAAVPNETRGSNFIMKLDDRSLPSGYRVTTENPRVQRVTRGKMIKFNFGAAIHRVVKLDLADGVFEKGSTTLRPQWRSRIDMLITELEKDASILRLSYLGENETEAEVDDRLDAIEDIISKRWEELDCCYKLTIEKEVFWRKGHPSDRKRFE